MKLMKQHKKNFIKSFKYLYLLIYNLIIYYLIYNLLSY